MPDFGAISTTLVPSNRSPPSTRPLPVCATQASSTASKRPGSTSTTNGTWSGRNRRSTRAAQLVDRVVAPAGLAGGAHARLGVDVQAERGRVDREVVLPGAHVDGRALELRRAVCWTAASASCSDIPLASTSPISTPRSTWPFSTMRSVSASRRASRSAPRDAEHDEPDALVVPGARERGSTRGFERRQRRTGARRGRRALDAQGATNYLVSGPSFRVRANLTARSGSRYAPARPAPGGARWPSRAQPAAPKTCAT